MFPSLWKTIRQAHRPAQLPTRVKQVAAEVTRTNSRSADAYELSELWTTGNFTSICVQGADIPFEQLIQIQQEGGSIPQLHSCSQARQQKPHHRQSAAKSFKRENKNRPVEQSSKRAVPRHRQVVETKLPYVSGPRHLKICICTNQQ